MLFPTHLVAAALVGAQSRLSMRWLVVGAAIPDILDKTLAGVGVVDLYHSVAHSALFAVAVLGLAVLHRAGVGVAVGWLSHVLLDAGHVVINGRPADALFLAWPILVPPDPLGLAPIPFAKQYLWSHAFFLEVGLWLAAGILLVRFQDEYRLFTRAEN